MFPLFQRLLQSKRLKVTRLTWLLLPMVAMLFWLGSHLMIQQVLGNAYGADHYLEAEVPTRIQLSATVLAIEVEIKNSVKFTKVRVKTADPALKLLEFEFPVTSIAQVETAIATELNLSSNRVSQLARYQMNVND
jgi:hypothetical protein